MLKLGDKLYKYTTPSNILEYTCTGVVKRKDATLFEMTCESCSHDYKCVILLSYKRGEYIFESMVSDDEEHEQECWHRVIKPYEIYVATAEVARRLLDLKNIAFCVESIRSAEKMIESILKHGKIINE